MDPQGIPLIGHCDEQVWQGILFGHTSPLPCQEELSGLCRPVDGEHRVLVKIVFWGTDGHAMIAR